MAFMAAVEACSCSKPASTRPETEAATGQTHTHTHIYIICRISDLYTYVNCCWYSMHLTSLCCPARQTAGHDSTANSSIAPTHDLISGEAGRKRWTVWSAVEVECEVRKLQNNPTPARTGKELTMLQIRNGSGG